MNLPAITHDSFVVANLLSRFRTDTLLQMDQLAKYLGNQVNASMVNTAYYALPLQQLMPDEAPPPELAKYVHPFNIAALLAAVVGSSIYYCQSSGNAGEVAPLPLELPHGLQLWNQQWTLLRDVEFSNLPVIKPPVATIPPAEIATPATLPPAAPPPPPPAATAAPPAPIAAPAPVAAAPAPVASAAAVDLGSAMADLAATAPAAAAAPITQAAAPAAPTRTFRQHPGLPAVDVMAPRTGTSGRPAKSAFERQYKARDKFGPAPYWMEEFLQCFPKMLTAAPPDAANSDSTSPTMVMAFGLSLALLRSALKDVPGNVTVAGLLDYINDVDAAATASPAGPVLYDLADNLATKKSAA